MDFGGAVTFSLPIVSQLPNVSKWRMTGFNIFTTVPNVFQSFFIKNTPDANHTGTQTITLYNVP